MCIVPSTLKHESLFVYASCEWVCMDLDLLIVFA